MKSVPLRVAVSSGNSKWWKHHLLRLLKPKIRHLNFQIFFSFIHLLLSICSITRRKALQRYLYRDFSCPRKTLYKVINKKELQNRCFGTAFTWASFPPNRWGSREIILWGHIKLNPVSTNLSYSKNYSKWQTFSPSVKGHQTQLLGRLHFLPVTVLLPSPLFNQSQPVVFEDLRRYSWAVL